VALTLQYCKAMRYLPLLVVAAFATLTGCNHKATDQAGNAAPPPVQATITQAAAPVAPAQAEPKVVAEATGEATPAKPTTKPRTKSARKAHAAGPEGNAVATPEPEPVRAAEPPAPIASEDGYVGPSRRRERPKMDSDNPYN
jgi:hypothetical protein